MTPPPDADLDQLPPGFASLRRTFMIGYRAEPRLLTLSLAMTLFVAIPDALAALWLRMLANGLADGDRRAVLTGALLLAGSATLSWALQLIFQRAERRFRDRVSIALESHVARLQATVSTIEHQERPAMLDRLSVLRDQVFALDHLFLSVFSTLGWLLRLAITVGLLASVHPAMLGLVVAALPIVWAAGTLPAAERAAEERAAIDQRRARHLVVLGTTVAPGRELRLAGTTAAIAAERRQAWNDWYRPIAAVRWRSAMAYCAAWTLFGAAYVAGIVFVAAGIDASAGSVLLVVAAGGRLSQYVGAAVGEIGFLRGIWLDSSRRLVWLERYAAQLVAEREVPVPERLDDGIRLDHVSFRYPGTERVVLDDVELHLPAGKVIAIVGENGAGKSSLVKLLARLYAPTEGRILADGADIAKMDVVAWRRTLGGAFQDFFRFELTTSETIGVGDLPRLGDDAALRTATIRGAADDVVAKLPAGLATQLGPAWENGVELSHGQWQRLALARGLMRDEPLLVLLDEPTSALDAETEYALFERFAGAAHDSRRRGGITVLVSHRFSTVRMADLIVVLDHARVVEVGSHEQLLAAGGQYAELYEIQAASFR